MSLQLSEQPPFTFRNLDPGCTFVTIIFAALGIVAIAALESFEYLLWVPVIAPIHFLRSKASLDYGLEWFAAGVPGRAGRLIERLGGKTAFAIYAGFALYVLASAASVYFSMYLQPPAIASTSWRLSCAAISGFLQIIFASALVGTLSIVLTGLGKGGADPAGGIDVAVKGSFGGAQFIVSATTIGSLAYVFTQSDWSTFVAYALGLFVASLVGAFAALGVVANIRENYEKFADQGYTTGASSIYAAIKDMTDKQANRKAVSGGILYLPGLPIGFFLAAFIIRFFSSFLNLWTCLKSMPDNMAQLYFATPLNRAPELIPNVPLNHDIRMGNVLGVALDAWSKGRLSNRVFAVFWGGMLFFWIIGGYSYRFYLNSSFFFMIPMLPIYETKISVKPIGIRDDWRKIFAIYSILSGFFFYFCSFFRS